MLTLTIARAAKFTVLALAGFLAWSPVHAYDFQTINNPADLTFNQLLGINNSGVIAGYYGNGTTNPNQGYTVAPPYTSFTSENFPGSVQTQVVGINNSGTTVGFWVDGGGNNFGFVDQGGVFTSVSNPASASFDQLLGVNDNGVAAGFYNDAGGLSHGYIYKISDGSFTAVTLPSTWDATSVTAADINNAGDIVGFYTDAGGAMHGFVEDGTTFTSVDAPGATETQLFGLNNQGFAVGDYVDAAGNMHGLVFNSFFDVFTTIDAPAGIGTTTFNGINDLNQIVGFYVDGAGNTDGLLVTGVPEPSTWAMLALGFAGLGFAGYCKARREVAALA